MQRVKKKKKRMKKKKKTPEHPRIVEQFPKV